MKAKVQYNDYSGTTAADRSDLFIEHPEQESSNIIERFDLPLTAEEYQFVGVSVCGTKVDAVLVIFYFKNRQTQEIVKCYNCEVKLQAILDMFKRFEFQIGDHLDDIDENKIIEIELE